MISSGDLLAEAAKLTAPTIDGEDHDFRVAVSDIYRALAKLVTLETAAAVREPTAA